MKVLLLGHKGWICQKVIAILDNQNIDYVITDYRGETDDLKQFILNNNITHIYKTLNDKVYTTIDYLENKETLHQNINDNLERVFEPKYNWDGTNFDVSFSDNEYIYSLYTLKNKNIKFEYIELGSYPKTMLATKELAEKFNLLYSYEN